MKDDTKILFMHNTAMWYRIPFFRKLSEIYDMNLVFTHINVIEDIYDNEADTSIKNLEGVNYDILPNKFGFAPSIITKALSDYDVLIGGSWDTPQELIESIAIYILTRLKGKKFIIWREDWDWEKNNNIKERLLHIVVKFLSNHADAILVPGSLHKDYFTKKLGVDEEDVYIMPNVSNISGNDKDIHKSQNNKQILYVGRLIPRKGINYLLEAYKHLQLEMDNISLVIVGSGPEKDNIIRYIEENNLKNVTLTGKIDNESLNDYYRDSNIVVIPSINDGMADPWVFVLNEAMYYYNPIVATTAVGAAADMVHGNGFIVDEKNSDALHAAMYKILSDASLEKEMGLKSKEIINNEFQYSNMVNSFINAINHVKK